VNRDFFIGTTSVQGSVYHAGILFLNGTGFWVRVIVYLHIFHFATVLQTLMASDNSVLNVDDTRYNPAASH